MHPRLSDLRIDDVDYSVKLSVVAPQLKNLCIRKFSKKVFISAPDIVYFLLHGESSLNFSADGFNSLEKVDICITNSYMQDSPKIVGLFKHLRTVKLLTLNVEMLEVFCYCFAIGS